MEVSNTSEFTLENEEVMTALTQGIAAGVNGVEASMVEILSIGAANRRLGARRLSSGRVTVSSEITGAPGSVTASDIQDAIAKVEKGINDKLAEADLSLTVSGLTASVSVKEPTAPTPAPSSSPEPPSSRAESGALSGSILALFAAVVMFRP